MSKQSQHVLIALPHPLLHLVSLGLVLMNPLMIFIKIIKLR